MNFGSEYYNLYKEVSNIVFLEIGFVNESQEYCEVTNMEGVCSSALNIFAFC